MIGQDVRLKLMWLSWESNSEVIDLEWESKMSIEADRAWRRKVYHAIARPYRNVWPRGHQWEVAVPAEERALVEVDPEEHLQQWAEQMLQDLAQPEWGMAQGGETRDRDEDCETLHDYLLRVCRPEYYP
ncbi:hypothetical protein Hypma_001339 [Hypsizygus marmoreus]|uniref:Uncharacterized protein n=1 Tax=Hypsizygus marmoreus TaxID=39966 RepID=A0A369K5U3_HYPMA|nr:hypothetical protein Hypma_001339 [Hypsizygus marmoreus]